MEEIVLNELKSQENFLINTRERNEKLRKPLSENQTFQYERAKFIGMLDLAKKLDIDVSEFNWIYNT